MTLAQTSQSDFTYTVGDVIAGKYALEELLGTGGMGAVFRARNTVIDMPVAIKVIRADLDRELLSGRLLQEARAAAKLAHPAIVRVFDVGKTALGDPFIVMELLHGESLGTLLERDGRLSGVNAVRLLLPIADALSVAHAKGLVHRDVKPDNVFIANDDEGQFQPKLVDFGIVKQEHAAGDSQLTQVGSVVGSPDYMSPEQARGLDGIDLRSDVWSFSVVLYEAITGHTPFSSDNYNALLRLIVETEAPTLREQSAADADLSAIVAQGMQKDPGGRFASMGQMGKALATWLYGQGFSEDACGVSLEARWLSRTSDPGRVSRSSRPDSWPEPPSGVRSISGKLGAAAKRLATAPTVEVGAGTPVGLAPASQPALSQRKVRGYLMAAAAITVAALGLAWFALSRSSDRDTQRAPSSAGVASEAQPERVVAQPLPANAPAPARPVVSANPALGATVAPESLAAPAKAALRPGVRPGSRPATPAPAAKESKPVERAAPPPSDLISPY